jgi:hypothetical protein
VRKKEPREAQRSLQARGLEGHGISSGGINISRWGLENVCRTARAIKRVTSDRKRILKRGGDVVDVDGLTLQWKDFKSAASLDSTHFARGTRDPPSLLHWSPIRTCTLTGLNPLDFDALSSFYPLFSIPFDEVALHVTSPKLRLGGRGCDRSP